MTLLGAMGGTAEATLPDIHDVDAGLGARVASSIDHVVSASHEADSPSETSSPAQIPGHSTHVEHCGHSHVLVLATVSALSRKSTPPTVALSASATIPASVSQSPEQRPPIA
jgi:hypothetical protein